MNKVRVSRLDASEHLDGAEVISAYLREALANGDDASIMTAIDDVARTSYFRPITNEEEYALAVSVLNALLDLPESSEGGPLAGLLVALGEFVSDYEDSRH
ncbi:transcriptional regulator [Paraburkholderia tropica]|uniref:transcriptional regulator n=1 Tax=Paraburkholderia tropica TaxID=92647 RepID=UPI001590F270|nr:transcriptional regulator [Paraburkholderia tropica]